jgi:dihydroorotate dehydrogenase (fumarate)
MTDLHTTYMGLELRSPLVASSSPLTRRLDSLRALEDAGAGAVVLPSLFEEQLTDEQLQIDRTLAAGADSFPEALSYMPELDDYNTGPDSYLDLVRSAKEALDIPVIASLNGATEGGWINYAHMIQSAGADGLELNVYRVIADPAKPPAEVEREYLEIVKAVRGSIDLPLAVKIGPYFSSLGHTARELIAVGANALVLFNRFYQPDLDLDSLDVVPRLTLSTSDELRLPLRWIAILHDRVDADLAATTGIHSAEDALKALLAGATVTMMASALLHEGPEQLGTVERGIVEWLDEREYASVDQLRGSVASTAAEDPEAFERANYAKTLRAYSSRFDA